jgi:hypothetical protein
MEIVDGLCCAFESHTCVLEKYVGVDVSTFSGSNFCWRPSTLRTGTLLTSQPSISSGILIAIEAKRERETVIARAQVTLEKPLIMSASNSPWTGANAETALSEAELARQFWSCASLCSESFVNLVCSLSFESTAKSAFAAC